MPVAKAMTLASVSVIIKLNLDEHGLTMCHCSAHRRHALSDPMCVRTYRVSHRTLILKDRYECFVVHGLNFY